MKNLTVINHYDDKDLVWSEKTGRYELTPEYCKDNFESTFKSDAVLKRRISLNSRIVYNYILTHGATVNKPVVSFLLDRTQEGRNFLLELLSAQMYADIQTGYNDLLYQPPINYNGNDKDREMVKNNQLCPAAELIYEESDTYLGVRLGYQGQYPWPLFVLLRSYIK